MSLKDIQAGISEYRDLGWRIKEMGDGIYESVLHSPDKTSYPLWELRFDICTICEGYECSGAHLEEAFEEEKEAKKLCDLIFELPYPEQQNLPEDFEL